MDKTDVILHCLKEARLNRILASHTENAAVRRGHIHKARLALNTAKRLRGV